MIEVQGRKITTCDGWSRRSLIKVGFCGIGGLTLADLWRAKARAGEARSNKAIIFVELAGGPTHFETYDPKPDAPAEYRGPLGVVKTNVPGVVLSALMSEQAKVMDKLAIIRSMHHASGSHGTSSHLVQTGYYLGDRQNRDNEMPCIGSIVAKLKGANASGIPPFVSMPREMRYGRAAYLGKGMNPFVATGDPNNRKYSVKNLSLIKGLDIGRLQDRRNLLSTFDAARRTLDTRGVATAIDKFTGDAFEMITGDRARDAFDLKLEDDASRGRYGRTTTGQSFLLARRLVEAGVSFVTVRPSGSWDDHNGILRRMESKGPAYDKGLAALVSDLHGRGLDKDVMVIAMGEFGRTPRVNRNAGRDHWGAAMSVLMAGGGLKCGQVVGSTNARGEEPSNSPYRPQNVLAMAYRHLGIDPRATFDDLAGRPRYILEECRLIDQLV